MILFVRFIASFHLFHCHQHGLWKTFRAVWPFYLSLDQYTFTENMNTCIIKVWRYQTVKNSRLLNLYMCKYGFKIYWSDIVNLGPVKQKFYSVQLGQFRSSTQRIQQRLPEWPNLSANHAALRNKGAKTCLRKDIFHRTVVAIDI